MEQINRLPSIQGSLMLSLHYRINEVKTIVAICSGPGSIHKRYGCSTGFFTFLEG